MEAIALLNAITGGLFAMAGILMVWAARTLYALDKTVAVHEVKIQALEDQPTCPHLNHHNAN